MNYSSSPHLTLTKQKAPSPGLFGSFQAIGQMPHQPISLFQTLHDKYGDIVRLNLGFNEFFLLGNVEHIKYVLHKNISNYQKLKRLENATKRLFGEGWTDSINREMVKPFFQAEQFVGMDSQILDLTEKMLDRWRTYADNQQPVDVGAEMMRLSLSFTAKSFISDDLDGGTNEIAQQIETIMDYLNNRAISNFNFPENFPTPANRQYLAFVANLQTGIDRIIAEHESEKNDLISVFKSWRDPKTGTSLNSRLLRERLLWMLLPSFEPVGRVLGWAWYLLSLHPKVEQQMHGEIEREIGDRPPTFADLPRLEYTKAIVQETLRLYPPFWVMGRQAIQDDTIGGFHIPAKSTVLFNIYGVHHNREYWDNSSEFQPERFLSHEQNRTAFLPFSIGPRACLGYNLSMMQIILVMAKVAQFYHLSLLPNLIIKPLARASLIPDRDIQMKLFYKS
jgi:cytochrome P450